MNCRGVGLHVCPPAINFLVGRGVGSVAAVEQAQQLLRTVGPSLGNPRHTHFPPSSPQRFAPDIVVVTHRRISLPQSSLTASNSSRYCSRSDQRNKDQTPTNRHREAAWDTTSKHRPTLRLCLGNPNPTLPLRLPVHVAFLPPFRPDWTIKMPPPHGRSSSLLTTTPAASGLPALFPSSLSLSLSLSSSLSPSLSIVQLSQSAAAG
ncbi:hypothetical protein B0T20DRAFT_165242 [Sordaria brevicollis]|uniref:Uncharacterized protein n=1 Tax=Sordaria brevicollis TaxID=83679 RepID=A0AAE0PHD9_SORBR|nr:hypothetical protein B0T20DRAFT_165242 [Sordaria brevicollis]